MTEDEPQWYWAVATNRGSSPVNLAGDRFVVARGRPHLWQRVRSDVDPGEQCSWMSFGPKDGAATLADCIHVLLTVRESYGAKYNRAVTELAQVPAFARFIHEAPADLCNSVSNPMSDDPLPREPYGRDAERRLGQAVARTLGLSDEWWIE